MYGNLENSRQSDLHLILYPHHTTSTMWRPSMPTYLGVFWVTCGRFSVSGPDMLRPRVALQGVRQKNEDSLLATPRSSHRPETVSSMICARKYSSDIHRSSLPCGKPPVGSPIVDLCQLLNTSWDTKRFVFHMYSSYFDNTLHRSFAFQQAAPSRMGVV